MVAILVHETDCLDNITVQEELKGVLEYLTNMVLTFCERFNWMSIRANMSQCFNQSISSYLLSTKCFWISEFEFILSYDFQLTLKILKTVSFD